MAASRRVSEDGKHASSPAPAPAPAAAAAVTAATPVSTSASAAAGAGGAAPTPTAKSDEEATTRITRRCDKAAKSNRLDLGLPKVKAAFVSFPPLTQLPRKAIPLRGTLQELWLTNNAFEEIPGALVAGDFKALHTLCMSGNKISIIPAGLCNLPLRRLMLADNRLETVPDQFSGMTALRELRLDGNAIVSFPKALCRLRELQQLGLSRNKLQSIPSEIRGMASLVEANFDDNRIGPDLPIELLRLAGLSILGVANNCLEEAPKVQRRGRAAQPLLVIRLEGNRASTFKVVHASGMTLEGVTIPRRNDGYLELRKGVTSKTEEGKDEHKIIELEGYVTESAVHNIRNARVPFASEAAAVLRARAQRLPWRTVNRLQT